MFDALSTWFKYTISSFCDMKREGQLISNNRTYLYPNGSHLNMYDDQENYFTNLIAFLKDVEDNL